MSDSWPSKGSVGQCACSPSVTVSTTNTINACTINACESLLAQGIDKVNFKMSGSVTKYAWVVQSPTSANTVLVQATNAPGTRYTMVTIKAVPPGGHIFLYGHLATQSPYVFTCETPFPASEEALMACIPNPLRPSPVTTTSALPLAEIIMRRRDIILPLLEEAGGDEILASEYLAARY